MTKTRRVPKALAPFILMPGTSVEIPHFGLEATVVPFGIRHLRRFGDVISALLKRVGEVDLSLIVRQGEDMEVGRQRAGAKLASELAPMLTEGGLDLVAKCVTFRWLPDDRLRALVDEGVLDGRIFEAILGDEETDPAAPPEFDDLPHDVLPPILDAWIVESFASEARWRPWVAAIDKAVEKATGQPFSTLETLSSLRSPPDTTAPTSSTDSSQESLTVGGHTPSSPSGQSEREADESRS